MMTSSFNRALYGTTNKLVEGKNCFFQEWPIEEVDLSLKYQLFQQRVENLSP